MTVVSTVARLLAEGEETLLEAWIEEQLGSLEDRRALLDEQESRRQSGEFLALLRSAVASGEDTQSPAWERVREFLAHLSRSRALQGFLPADAALFVFSLRKPLLERLAADGEQSPADLSSIASMLDRLGLFTMEVYQATREDVIRRQQQEMLELSTPVVKLWEGVLALPLIGTLDSDRTQVVMESLLERIVETNSPIAIIDITGVPTVDTLVAQHLLKTVSAARLMGADCIISGIRPQIAQTIVHLGVQLGDVVTKATMADAVALALEKSGFSVIKSSKGQEPWIVSPS